MGWFDLGGSANITFAGDLSGNNTTQQVIGIKGKLIDDSNIANGYILKYNEITDKLEYAQDGGGGGSSSTTQKVVLNVPNNSYTETITTTASNTLNLGKIEVLKYIQGLQNQTNTINNFNNGEASGFTYNPSYVVFDGKMHLINTYNTSMTSLGAIGIGNGKHFKSSLNITNFKNLEKVEVV